MGEGTKSVETDLPDLMSAAKWLRTTGLAKADTLTGVCKWDGAQSVGGWSWNSPAPRGHRNPYQVGTLVHDIAWTSLGGSCIDPS